MKIGHYYLLLSVIFVNLWIIQWKQTAMEKKLDAFVCDIDRMVVRNMLKKLPPETLERP